MKSIVLAVFLLVCPASSAIAQPWRKPVDRWSAGDANRLLTNSPWSKQTKARGKPASITIRWESAMPVRQAHRRRGIDPIVPERTAAYAISVAGLPETAGELLRTGAADASLQYCKDEAVKATAVKVAVDGDGRSLLVFYFPLRSDVRTPGVFRYPFGLTFHLDEFHFTARIGPYEIRKAFSLREMLYFRQLEL